jgi:S-adenosylmethionine:tRNA ribosyltransferase-isomerase
MPDNEGLDRYDYSFPKELIAQSPASPRDSAKLLVYDRASGETRHDTFHNLPTYIPKDSLLVLNQTKVIPARLTLMKSTGGKVRILYLETEKAGRTIRALADRPLKFGEVLNVMNGEKKTSLQFEIVSRETKDYQLKPLFPIKNLSATLDRYGAAPIPPYIKEAGKTLSQREIKNQYQTVFAKTAGSVAAPTASLHFTKALLTRLAKNGVKIAYVTLHVGLGTFATVTDEHLKTGKLHEEWYEIPAATQKLIATAKKQNRPIIAVGTTVVRTLESAAAKRPAERAKGTTSLFIREGYQFKTVTGMITNFHVPKSSLLMLVGAFVGKNQDAERGAETIHSLYQEAIKKKYRLFSFGDGMLIL